MLCKTYNLTNEGVTLTAYILDSSPEMPKNALRPAMLICPGGAYVMCSDREAEPVAMHFLSMGINTFVLRYSLKENSVFPKPLNDAQEAFEFILDRADEFNIDKNKTAVCGFSAGGHLAAALGILGKRKPSVMVLGYPCITEDICRGTVLYSDVPPLDGEVTKDTPPAFVFAAADDGCVPIRSTLDLCSALSKNGVSFEAHIFEKGGHGFSTADAVTCSGNENPDVQKWVGLCKSFLNRRFFS